MAKLPRIDATDIALIAGFAALTAVCSVLPQIEGAGSVPFTLQTFGVGLAGAVLGARRGFLSMLLYLVIGSAGVPIFAGGTAGLGQFATASGGYLASFPLVAALIGYAVSLLPRRSVATSVPLVFAAGFLGVVLCHACGIVGMRWNLNISWTTAWSYDSPFWFADTLKDVAVAIVATAVHRAFPGLLPRRRVARLDAVTA